MKILISKPEGIVLQLNVVEVDDNNAYGSNWIDATVNSSNSEIVEASSTPEIWQRGCYVFANDVWSFLNAETEAIITVKATQRLTAVRDKITTSIKEERDRRKFNGVYVSNKWVHTDTYSRTQWMGMVMMGETLPAIEWTTMDGTNITTTPTLAGQVFQAAATLDTTLFAHATSLIDAVNASNTPDSIDITTGWPLGYGE